MLMVEAVIRIVALEEEERCDLHGKTYYMKVRVVK